MESSQAHDRDAAAARSLARLARRGFLAVGVPFALGLGQPGWSADPDAKNAAATKARLAKIAASGTKDERLDVIARLAQVATPDSADWIAKAAFDRKAEDDVRLTGIAALATIGTDPSVARHLVTIAERDLQKPNGEYLLAAALGVGDVNVTAPLRDVLDKEGAKKKPVYTRCCKAAALAGQVNEAAHKAGEDPTGHSIEALKNLCRLSLFSEGPKYEKGAPTLRRAVTQGFIACHQTEAVDALFELAEHLLEKPYLDAELDALAYFHEISGEFLGSDLAVWKEWWEREGRDQPLHPRRVDREGKLEGRKRVVVIYGHWTAPHPKLGDLMPRVIRNTIRDIPDGSDFCILQAKNFDQGTRIFIDGGRATPGTKSRAVASLFDADDFLEWYAFHLREPEVPCHESPFAYDCFAYALKSLDPTEIIYIHAVLLGAPNHDYSPGSYDFDGRPLFRDKGFFDSKRNVRLITGANRHHKLGGVSIKVFAGFPTPTDHYEGNLLATGNWGNYHHDGVQAELLVR